MQNSLGQFKKLIDQISFEEVCDLGNFFLGRNLFEDLESSPAQNLLSVSGADASQRMIGMGETRFRVFRSTYLENGVALSDFLLVPPSGAKNFGDFLNTQIEHIFQAKPSLSFIKNSELWFDFNNPQKKFSEHFFRNLLEFAAHLESLRNPTVNKKILLIDGYLNINFLNEEKKSSLLNFCRDFYDGNVLLCGVIKSNPLLGKAFYEAQRKKLNLDKPYICKINYEVISYYFPKGLNYKDESSYYTEEADDNGVRSVEIEQLEKIEKGAYFDYYMLFLNGSRSLPCIIQIFKGYSVEEQKKILSQVISASNPSHPLSSYPFVLNEAHNISYFSEIEENAFELVLNEKIKVIDPLRGQYDFLYNVARNRNKTR